MNINAPIVRATDSIKIKMLFILLSFHLRAIYRIWIYIGIYPIYCLYYYSYDFDTILTYKRLSKEEERMRNYKEEIVKLLDLVKKDVYLQYLYKLIKEMIAKG